MSFWCPAEQSRGAHGYWWNSALLKSLTLGGLAARLFYDHFKVLPSWAEAENDRDHIRW